MSCQTLWTPGLQLARLPCPSPSHAVCSNSCPLSQWCYPTITSSVAPFASCPQSLPTSGSFLMSLLFTSGGQSFGASASVLPMNIQGWFPLGLTGLISLQSKELSRVFSGTTVQKQLWHTSMTTGKTIALTLQTFVCKVIFLPFNIPSTFVIVFLTRNKCLNFMASVIIHSDFGAQESKICHCFHFFSIYLPWSDSIRYHDLHFLNIEFLASFYTPPLHPHVFPFCFLPLEWYHLHIWGYWYFSQQSWFQLVIYPTWHFTWYTLHIS